jgi:hypothetical protein
LLLARLQICITDNTRFRLVLGSICSFFLPTLAPVTIIFNLSFSLEMKALIKEVHFFRIDIGVAAEEVEVILVRYGSRN